MLDLDGYVTSWNAGAVRTKGYTAAEIMGRYFGQFYTPEDQAAGKPAQALAIARETGRFGAEGWRVRKDGSRFWALVVIDAVHDDDGNLIGFAKITRDITERRALEEAKEQLHQAQKMETVGQLTGGMAHDFNNLLTAVTGSLELIARLAQDPRVYRLVETAQRAVGRGSKLVAQLLAFSRRQTLKPEISQLNELIGRFETLLHHAAGEAIALELDLAPGLWLTDIDQAQFQAALLNLVVNARDAMPGGGKLVIRTRNLELDASRPVLIGDIGAGTYVTVSVTDNGEGMTEAVRARAIEPFFTTKDVGRGSGLGLSQVYGFVRQSKGHIDIESAIGEGTTVLLYLPGVLDASIAQTMSSAAVQAEEPSAGVPSVLVVEDDIDVREIAVESLKSFGYAVHAAADALEALDFLRRGTSVDVLFTDVVMPGGMSGVELARAARLLLPELRVLLASGFSRDALQQRENIAHDMALIAKPYRLPELADRLRAMTESGRANG